MADYVVWRGIKGDRTIRCSCAHFEVDIGRTVSCPVSRNNATWNLYLQPVRRNWPRRMNYRPLVTASRGSELKYRIAISFVFLCWLVVMRGWQSCFILSDSFTPVALRAPMNEFHTQNILLRRISKASWFVKYVHLRTKRVVWKIVCGIWHSFTADVED